MKEPLMTTLQELSEEQKREQLIQRFTEKASRLGFLHP